MDDIEQMDKRVVTLLQVLSVLGPALTDEQVQVIIAAVFKALDLEVPEAEAPAALTLA